MCFVSGFAHLAQCCQGLSPMWHASECLSFLRLDHIPPRGWTAFCLSIPPGDGPVGGLHFLALLTHAAENMDVPAWVWGLCSQISGCISGIELQDGHSRFNFGKTTPLFSTATAPFYILPQRHGRASFSRYLL